MSTPSQRPAFLAELGDEIARVAAEQGRTAARRRAHRTRTLALSGVASLLLAGGAGAATGVVSLHHVHNPYRAEGQPPDPPVAASPGATASFSPALRATVSVLGRPRTDADALKGTVEGTRGDMPAPGSALRVVPPPAHGPHAQPVTMPMWLVPYTAGDMAIYIQGPQGALGGGGAADARAVKRGAAVVGSNTDVFGVVPDGVRSVTVTLRDGTLVTLPVANNVFGAHLDQERKPGDPSPIVLNR
jgi:hypothetical protein